MQYHAFVIKYAEIGIKGKNRYLFEEALVRQMERVLENARAILAYSGYPAEFT